MRQVTLTRTKTSSMGTFGTLKVLDSGYTCVTGELPDRNNLPDKSCIPAGQYECLWLPSLIHIACYHLQNVPNRTAIEIHSANLCGDIDAGFKCQLLGCICVGQSLGTLFGQTAVMNSKKTLLDFEAEMNQQPFSLTIYSV